jgi:hypothetical protein
VLPGSTTFSNAAVFLLERECVIWSCSSVFDALQQSPEKIFFKANAQRSPPHQECHLLQSDSWQKKLQKQFVFLRVWHECCFHHLEEPIINLQRKRKKG